MKQGLRIAAIAVVGLVVLFIGLLWGNYNALVRAEVTIEEKYTVIESKLQLRSDAIQQLVASISGLQEYASSIYEMITTARTQYLNAKNSGDAEGLNEAEILETEAVVQLLALIESNPEGISVSGQYQTLLDAVLSFEYQLDIARQNYNGVVADYNESVRLFPRVLFVGLFQFETSKPYWEISDAAGELPVIEID